MVDPGRIELPSDQPRHATISYTCPSKPVGPKHLNTSQCYNRLPLKIQRHNGFIHVGVYDVMQEVAEISSRKDLGAQMRPLLDRQLIASSVGPAMNLRGCPLYGFPEPSAVTPAVEMPKPLWVSAKAITGMRDVVRAHPAQRAVDPDGPILLLRLPNTDLPTLPEIIVEEISSIGDAVPVYSFISPVMHYICPFVNKPRAWDKNQSHKFK